MTRKQGSIKRKPPGRYQIRIELGMVAGRRRTYAVTLNCTLVEANKQLTRLLRERDEGTLLSPISLTLSEWIDEWLQTHAAVSVRQRTLDGYRDMARRYIMPQLGTVQVQTVQRQDIEKWVAAMATHGLAARTIRLAFSVLHNSLSALVQAGDLKANPCTGVKRPKKERAKVASLTREQAQELLASPSSEPFRALWALMLTTAVRPSEALALRWEDVVDGKVRIQRSLSWTSKGPRFEAPKTHQGYRTIPLDCLVATLLHERHLKSAFKEFSDLIFCNSEGGPLDPKLVARRHFHPMLKRRGLPRIRLYDLRHTGTTLLLVSGVTLPLLKERLGHKDAAYLIDTYAHVLPSQQEAATASLSHLLGTDQATHLATAAAEGTANQAV